MGNRAAAKGWRVDVQQQTDVRTARRAVERTRLALAVWRRSLDAYAAAAAELRAAGLARRAAEAELQLHDEEARFRAEVDRHNATDRRLVEIESML